MSKNTKVDDVDDFLTEDPEIPSQKFVLLSFLSPEKILENKDRFFFQEFLKNYEIQWRTTRLEAWLAQQLSDMNTRLEGMAGKLEAVGQEVKDLSGAVAAGKTIRENLLRVDRFVEEFQQYVRKSNAGVSTGELKEAYDDYLFKNAEKLEDEFFKKNDFHTTIRGIKVRGVFPSHGEAAARAKSLNRAKPNVDILMGTVGKWMAWDPNPNSGIKSEYANEQLNNLMKKYQENEESREQFYSERKKERMGGAKTRQMPDSEAQETTKVTESAASTLADTPFGGSTPAGSGNFDAMFSGTGDLAIQRKMEKTEKKDD